MAGPSIGLANSLGGAGPGLGAPRGSGSATTVPWGMWLARPIILDVEPSPGCAYTEDASQLLGQNVGQLMKTDLNVVTTAVNQFSRPLVSEALATGVNRAQAWLGEQAGDSSRTDDSLRVAAQIFARHPGGKKMVVMTGLSPAVKTAGVSLSVAQGLALLSEGPVLLVDLDATQPLAPAGGGTAPNTRGFLDALDEPLELASIIQPTPCTGLSVLGLGSSDANFRGRIMSEQCPLLLKELRHEFPWIVVRCASLASPESLRIASQSDGVCCILKPGKHSQRELRTWHDLVTLLDIPCVGAIFAT